MRIYRIADSRHAVWDGTGAMLLGGRWNSPGRQVIYGAMSLAGAMLEILAHARIGRIPATQVCVCADVPETVSVETLALECLPTDWDAPDLMQSRRVGDQWLAEGRSAVLLVPSVIARQDFNVLVNPVHPEVARLVISVPEAVIWDSRLFPFA